MSRPPSSVGLLVYDGCDLLDLGGPYEALLTAARLRSRGGGPAGVDVRTLGHGPGPWTAYGGLGLVPHAPAAEVDHLDVLVVPGTVDLAGALADEALVATVARLAGASDHVSSVCTGSFLLAAAGLLVDRRATTHHEDLDALAARDDVGAVERDRAVVEDGDVTTAAGLSTGLALGLRLVARLFGEQLARETAVQLEYDPDRDRQHGWSAPPARRPT